MAWLEFVRVPTPRNIVTDRYAVAGIANGQFFGTIKFYPHWRRYVFEPQPGTIFDGDCLGEIAGFLKGLKQ